MSWADFEEAWQKSPAPGQSAETSSQEKTSVRKVAGLSREKEQSTVVIFVELARSPVQLLVFGISIDSAWTDSRTSAWKRLVSQALPERLWL